uniref:Uridylate-specific endoribonuclease n=1 Tax=Sus scrofa TaxID=9823 RepID=A0A8D0MX23_PIG
MTLELEQAALPCFPGSGPTVPSPKSSVSLSPDRYSSEQEFVDDLKNMWFGLYSRGSEEGDSSGFEHVFSGEVKKGKVTGFHNWIRFYMQEKEGLVDYYSHIYDGPVGTERRPPGLEKPRYPPDVLSAFCSPHSQTCLSALPLLVA